MLSINNPRYYYFSDLFTLLSTFVSISIPSQRLYFTRLKAPKNMTTLVFQLRSGRLHKEHLCQQKSQKSHSLKSIARMTKKECRKGMEKQQTSGNRQKQRQQATYVVPHKVSCSSDPIRLKAFHVDMQ